MNCPDCKHELNKHDAGGCTVCVCGASPVSIYEELYEELTARDEEIAAYDKDAKSGDYNHLVQASMAVAFLDV